MTTNNTMKIYVHKVRVNPINGWGMSTGIETQVIGRYKDKSTAIESKTKRDQSKDATYCDVGSSWIEEEYVI